MNRSLSLVQNQVFFDNKIGPEEGQKMPSQKGIVGIEVMWKYSDAAKFLDVSIRTIKRLVKDDSIPYTKIGTSVRFCPWKLREWSQKGGSR